MNCWIKIKDFGKDRIFRGSDAVDELFQSLKSEYRNKHVSIVYQGQGSHMLSTIFVTVDRFGNVYDTYTKFVINFDSIKRDLGLTNQAIS